MYFLEWKCITSDYDLTEVCPQVFNKQYASIWYNVLQPISLLTHMSLGLSIMLFGTDIPTLWTHTVMNDNVIIA